jgi:bifunctional N-acetylglucosamine-1-phosphate-uridyltransferase/glucosamine-1-phosphate-acetyltransferase GlmU-like protein
LKSFYICSLNRATHFVYYFFIRTILAENMSYATLLGIVVEHVQTERILMFANIEVIVLATSFPFLPSFPSLLSSPFCGQPLIMYPLSTLDAIARPIMVMSDEGTVSTVAPFLERHYPHYRHITTTATNFLDTLDALRPHWHGDTLFFITAYAPLLTLRTLEQALLHHRQTGSPITVTPASHAAEEQYPSITLIDRTFFSQILTLRSGALPAHATFRQLVHYIATKAPLAEAMVTAHEIEQCITTDAFESLEHIKRQALIRFWKARGVRFAAAHTVYIDSNVEIGIGCYIGTGAHLRGHTRIGDYTTIDAYAMLESAQIGAHVTIHPYSIVCTSSIGDHAVIGPFAHVQAQSHIGAACTIGNFVETKRVTMENHTKAKHLTYLGDATIGSHVNIGAGTITCNYDGTHKNSTIIEDNVFIGSNNSLVAPLTIGHDAFTAAGSVVTEDVPAYALAIGRARQINKEGYAHKKNEQASETSTFRGATKTSNDAMNDQ